MPLNVVIGVVEVDKMHAITLYRNQWLHYVEHGAQFLEHLSSSIWVYNTDRLGVVSDRR